MVRLRFVYTSDPVSAVIRAYDEPHLWSHVDLMTPEGMYLGSRSDVCGGVPAGVQIRPVGYTPFDHEEIVSLPATPEQEAAFWIAARLEIGKPYDSFDLVANFAGARDWRNADAWWCSEYGEHCCERSGIFGPTPGGVQIVTPDSLYVRAAVVTPVRGAYA